MTQIHLTGLGFSKAFMDAMPDVEKSLSDAGYLVSAFAIDKNYYNSGFNPIGGGVIDRYSYTIHVEGEKFSIPFTNDMDFLKYFTKICFSEVPVTKAPNPFVSAKPSLLIHLQNTWKHTEEWLSQSILTDYDDKGTNS